jgi:excisionase family DNA binding protein
MRPEELRALSRAVGLPAGMLEAIDVIVGERVRAEVAVVLERLGAATLTTSEVASRKRVTTRTVRRWVEEGRLTPLPGSNPRRPRFDAREVDGLR